MATAFHHEWPTQRVEFAPDRGEQAIIEALQARDGTRGVLVASSSQLRRFARLARQPHVAAVLDKPVMHVPAKPAADAVQLAERSQANLVIAAGGGSAIGLAKIIARDTGIPLWCLPTTLAGSEATDVWGMTTNGRKHTGKDRLVRPQLVVYDPSTLLSLPPSFFAASAINALAHSVDSVWAPGRNFLNRAIALQAARDIVAVLEALQSAAPGTAESVSGPAYDPASVGQLQLACYDSALAFSFAGSGLHHWICHALGGSLNLPHAETHSVILPQVIAYRTAQSSQWLQEMTTIFGETDPGRRVADIAATWSVPTSLAQLGADRQELPKVAAAVAATAVTKGEPSVTSEAIAALLDNAWLGVI